VYGYKKFFLELENRIILKVCYVFFLLGPFSAVSSVHIFPYGGNTVFCTATPVRREMD